MAVTDGWYELLRAELAHATIAAPVFLDADGSVQETGHHRRRRIGVAARRRCAGANCIDDLCLGVLASIRRADFERLGGFDTGYHPAALRRRRRAPGGPAGSNGTVVVGSATVRHFRRGSTADGKRGRPVGHNPRARFRRAWPDVVACAAPPPT
ncbi:MAG: hypothetical protein R2697_07890 [Ilumatobacteraceae bacterium]